MELLRTIKDTLTTAIDNLKDYLDEDTTLTRKTIACIGFTCILIGIIYGFIISPIKKGFNINFINNDFDEDDFDDDDFEE